MSKSGFSTLNRWLGRKNKDKSMVNGKLSKSSTNLSISSTNINETSQLEYNRITPLPAATTNAPFEQTFRITVLLPKDQLYVTRLGARVPLSKLLELVCDNKLLDAEKYEFRNPVDPSQVYSCDLTIGAVGLSEIRLCHKTESYDNFNSDEIIKLHRTSLIRESLSSSEFSSRNSKHTTKTTSPYSSTNSLNSMDSTALSYGDRTNKLPANTTTAATKMSAPPRKKRAAPRPPSQIAIPEKSALIMENGEEKENVKSNTTTTTTPTSPLKTKDFSVSSPNLSLSSTSTPLMLSDINGNDCNGHLEEGEEEEDYHEHENSSGNGSLNSNGYTEDTVLYAQIQKKNALNLHNQSQVDVERGDCMDNCSSKLPEPSPRKRIVQVKKKTVAPPAPPPRHTLYQEDTVSLASTNASSISTPTTPKGVLNNSLESLQQEQQQSKVFERMDSNRSDIPTPQPRITTSSTNSTSTTLLNATTIEEDLKLMETSNNSTTTTITNNNKTKPNISKVLLNRTPTPEPRSLSCEPPEIMDSCYSSQMQHFKQQQNKTEDDCISKQADSGIGEPVPSPIPDSLPLEVSNLDVKSNFESSSDDDDMVKVYNFKLGKTLVKPMNETKTLEELTVMNQVQEEEETDNEAHTPLILNQHQPTPSTVSETSSWNFAIPISPPPNFADAQFNNDLIMELKETKPDAPITPKIMERPVLNFEELKQEQEITLEEQKPLEKTESLTTPLDNIVDELTAIIQDKALDTLIKKPEDCVEIEAAKPNTLSNFTINTISQTNGQKPKEIFTEEQITQAQLESLPKDTSETDSTSITNTVKSISPISSPAITPDEEKLYRKRSSITSLKQRKSITRSDSFHTTAACAESLNPNKRTSSQLSLDQSTGHLNRRKSSSELSIGESPSLQSLEIIKTILNSRKNSLANSSASEEEPYVEVQARRPSEELKFASLELKMSNQNDITEERPTTEEEPPQQTQQMEEKSKELPKVYRYSGPPSINFSTWNERPKQQVAIKNEGDYIFGGGNPNRVTMPAASMNTFTPPLPPPVAPKPAAIQRMGIPEKEYKVPITVKPIQDVVVDKVKPPVAKETEAPQQQQPQSKVIQMPKATKETIVSFTADRSILRPASQRPTVESVLRPQTQIIVNTSASTLPRTNNQKRFSMPQNNNNNHNSNSQHNSLPPGPQLLRSTSIKEQQQQQQPIKPATAPAEPTLAPFGQNTLRRTGLKEKILAKEEEPMKGNTNQNQKPSTINGDLRYQQQQQQQRNTITSAKLHLNLKKTTTTHINNEGSNTSSASFISSSSQLNPTPPPPPPTALKPKHLSPQTAPVLSNKHNIFSNTTTATTIITPPPPPPPAMITRIQLKPVSTAARSTPTTPSNNSSGGGGGGDPRDQLLDAIRNFNKQGLKKA